MQPMRDNPCRYCVPPKRTPTCHATCVDYAIAKAFHNAAKAEELMEKEVTSYGVSAVRRNSDRSRKRKQDLKGYNWLKR